jgi:RNA polymerase sigma-70 factor, ECF subfamily
MATSPEQVTVLLRRAREPNDHEAREQLYPLVEAELRHLAEALLRRRDGDHTLQATALIDEAFVRLVMGPGDGFDGRRQFYRIAGGVMRRLLINHARRQRPGRLAGEQLANVPADGDRTPDERLQRAERLLALDRALDRLRAQDEEAADLFELHYFGGLRLTLGATPEEWLLEVPDRRPPLEETAAALGLKRATAYRLIHRAKQFLQGELAGEAG